jgi:hypothetical protein
MFYTLGTGAKAAGTSKASIWRAIKSGRISATREADGSFRIDPAELHRVFPAVSRAETPEPGSVAVTAKALKQTEMAGETDDRARTPPEPYDAALQAARLGAELAGVRELLRVREEQIETLTRVHREQTETLTRAHRDQIEDLRTERDKLLSQVDTAHRLLTHHAPQQPSRSWWPWRRSA